MPALRGKVRNYSEGGGIAVFAAPARSPTAAFIFYYLKSSGVAPVTYLPKCYTRQETCITIPFTEMVCVPCLYFFISSPRPACPGYLVVTVWKRMSVKFNFMKRKKVNLERKLQLNKATIAMLQPDHQQKLAGGLPTVTRIINCLSGEETCATIPGPTRPCQLCEAR
jgi:hypothetical protein